MIRDCPTKPTPSCDAQPRIRRVEVEEVPDQEEPEGSEEREIEEVLVCQLTLGATDRNPFH